jgi:hypothetical protein
MVSAGADDSNVDSVPLVPACVAVNNIDTVSGVEVVDCPLPVDLPYLPR